MTNDPKANQRKHETVVVEHDGTREEIDVNIAPLILEIWRAGINTMMSCEEVEPGISWVEFDSPDDYLRFLNRVVEYEENPDSLYARISTTTLAGGSRLPKWEHQLNLQDIYEDEPEQIKDGVVHFEATVGIYFPFADAAQLTERLRDVNEAMNPGGITDDDSA